MKPTDENETSLTVIVPTFNREQQVKAAVESVLTESSKLLNVIVVDDSSNDDTVKTLNEIADPRLKVIALTKKRGGNYARNVGIDNAEGNIIAFLDSDDRWITGKFKIIQEYVHTWALKESWIGFHNVVLQFEKKREFTKLAPFQQSQSVADYLFVRRNSIWTSTIFMPNHLAKKIRFDEKLRRLQDWDFYLRAEMEGSQFRLIPDVLVEYSVSSNKDRISNQKDPNMLLSWIEDRKFFISRSEYIAFIANKYASEAIENGQVLRGLKAVTSGFLSGVTSPKHVLVEFARAFLPGALFSKLVK